MCPTSVAHAYVIRTSSAVDAARGETDPLRAAAPLPRVSEVMGKNKQRVKKQQNVFQVANKQGKNKNKTKPVKTSLKHMNAVKNEKVENLNQIFTEVQRDVKSISKSVAPAPQKPMQVVKEAAKEAVNVDSAAQLFSQL
ncbi:unnamed protein product [Merluccius merluccius]